MVTLAAKVSGQSKVIVKKLLPIHLFLISGLIVLFLRQTTDQMGLNSIMKIFMPKDKIFYSLFEQVAHTVAKMGKLMKEVVTEPDFDKRAAIIAQIEDPGSYER